jgi:putative ABC transport system permease protein
MFRYLALIARNGLRNRRRSILTAGSFAVSMCLLGVLLAMYQALFLNSEAHPAQALRLVTHHKVSITQPLPVSYLARIRQIAGVRDAMVWQWFGGTYKDARDPGNSFARFAVNPDRFVRIKSEVALPQDQKVAFQQFRTACVVGKKLAERFRWKPGDRVTLVGDIFPVDLELKIVGIYSDPDDSKTLFFNYEYLRELLIASGQRAAQDSVGVFLVQANSPDDAPAVAAAIDKEFENSPAPTITESELPWQLSFISFLGNLKLFLLSVCCALTFTILLVSVNTISMSVRERAREVGIMKTLGFTPGSILWMISGESLCLALLGGFFGLVVAEALCALVRNSGSAFASLKMSLTPEVALVILLVAAVVATVGSIPSAWTASHRSILDSLRCTG